MRLAPLLLWALAALAVAAHAAEAQGLCNDNPQLASCQTPTLSVAAPARVDLATVRAGEAGNLFADFVVNVTYTATASAPGESATLTLSGSPPPGFGLTGSSATVTPGQTASVSGRITANATQGIGDYRVNLTIHAAGTGTQRPADASATTLARVPLVVYFLNATPHWVEYHSWGVKTAMSVEYGANGPGDVLITPVSSVPGERPSVNASVLSFAAPEPGRTAVRGVEAVIEGVSGAFELRLTVAGAPSAGGTLEIGVPFAPPPVDWWLQFALLFIFALVTVGELLLGLLVLAKGAHRLPGKLMGTYLVLHPITFGTFPLGGILEELRIIVPIGWSDVFPIVVATGLLLPSLDIAFALSYPTTHPWVVRRRWVLALPFLVSAAIFAVIVTQAGNPAFEIVGPLLLFGYLFTGAIGAGIIFWRRLKVATTALETRRIRYMMRVIAIPMAFFVIMLMLLMIGATFVLAESDKRIAEVLIALLFSGMVLVPAIGLGYGVLRYQMLDIDLHVRFAVSKGTLGSIFLALFFVMSEVAQSVLADRTNSAIVGAIGAGVVVFALAPLQRAADKMAERVVPVGSDAARYQEFRRWEVYRATFEDLSADAQITERERRALEALAKNLRLKPEDVGRIESEVARERGALAASATPGA